MFIGGNMPSLDGLVRSFLKPPLKPAILYLEDTSDPKGNQTMKTTLAHFICSLQKIDRQHIQLVMVLVALVLMVLGIGAPDDSGVPFGR